MNNLVIMNNQQVVTTSLSIAENFKKEHRNVLRDIEGLLKNEQTQNLFYEGIYEHPQNKQKYRMYYMNRDGFTLLAMGFTGNEALQFKLKYIEAFNKMEKQISKPINNLELALQAALQHEQDIKTLKNDVGQLKETMRIDGDQEYTIRKSGQAKALEAMGGYESTAYKSIGRKVYQAFWRDFKRYFKITRYTALPRVKYTEGIRFIETWRPETSLQMEIDDCNKYKQLELVEGGAESVIHSTI